MIRALGYRSVKALESLRFARQDYASAREPRSSGEGLGRRRRPPLLLLLVQKQYDASGSVSFADVRRAGSDLLLGSTSGRCDSDPLASTSSSASPSSCCCCSSPRPLASVASSCCSAAGGSGAGRGGPANRAVASEDARLCGADRHRISRSAFFGGTNTLVSSCSGAAVSSTSSTTSRSGVAFPSPTNSVGGGCLTGSGFRCLYAQLPPVRIRAHPRHSDRRPPPPLLPPVGLFRTANRLQRRAPWKHRHGIRDDLLLAFLHLGVFGLADLLLRIRT